MKFANRATLRKLSLCTVAMGSLTLGVGTAWAQTPAPAPQQEPVEQTTPTQETAPAGQENRITVTGSRIVRDAFTSSSPIVIITSEASALQGQIDTADILQGNSIASGSTQINGQLGGFLVEGGPGVRTVALRGLGSQRTLVLLNGRRLGGAGTTGTTGAVDLNVLPDSIVQRFEILKDGASSIYGSDAVAGVVNVITRNSVDRPELNLSLNEPFDTGGSSWAIDGAFGLNFDNGSITVSGSWQHREELDAGERAGTYCAQDYLFLQGSGERADIINTRPGDPAGFKCRGITNNIIQVLGNPPGGNGNNIVYVQGSPTTGPFPGLRPRTLEAGGVADLDLFHPLELKQNVLDDADLYSLFATADFDFGPVNFFSEVLLNRRESEIDGVSNYAPLIDQDNPFNPFPTAATPTSTVGAARAFIIRPFNTTASVDYLSAVAGLRGDFGSSGWLSSWSWETYASFNRSDGEYSRLVVDARNAESKDNPLRDVRTFVNAQGQIVCQRISNGAACPVINYLNSNIIQGNFTQTEFDFIFKKDPGTTTYDQVLVSGTVTGDLFELPAGDVGAAFGLEYRNIKLDDQPGPISQGGFALNSTAAGRTKGEDTIFEVFGELEVPLLRGLPFVEELTGNVSGRWFDYDSYGSDAVYKVGVNWQVNPLFRLRSTYGTSYRAPALFELFLANQTGFASALIDPCIRWGESSDPEIRANCAAIGIPMDFQGGTLGPTVISGGGFGVLEPETSDSLTVGLVLTPTQLDLSIAIDYFEIEVLDEISRFGAASIAGACYNAAQFPNGFCNLLTRNPASAPVNANAIVQIRDSFININNQRNEGLDVNIRYEHEFDFGQLLVEGQGTWTFADVIDLFQGGGVFVSDDFNGTIGDPDFTAGTRVSFERGDWTYNWFMDYVQRTSNDELFGNAPTGTFTNNSGLVNIFRKRYAETTIYHDFSVRYRNDDWSVIVGINNFFDEEPPAISSGAGSSRVGIYPVFGTQYDLLGRTGFIQVGRQF
jgi:iron complex outermembrane receptor protein